MKSYKKSFLLLLPVAAIAFAGCDDLEDRDYFDNTSTTNENVAVVSVAQTSADYIRSRADLTKMATLFDECAVFSTMESKGTLHTILVVTDSAYQEPDSTQKEFIANSHVTDISVSPSKLNDGDRLLMWHNKYVTITKDSVSLTGDIIGHILFNNASLQEVVSTTDGYIYVISDMIITPQSLQDYVDALDEEKYGIFKEMVLASGGKTFDKANSKVVGVDERGNTLYDSVWITTNEFFDAKNLNLSNEAIQATMFTFSDDVINAAMREADAKLRSWGYRSGTAGDPDYIEGRSDSILRRWILEVAFFNKAYTKADLTPQTSDDETVNDLKSIYNRQWRTSVQELDLDNPVEMSNGVVYDVTSLTIPTNMLIYRLKAPFYYYEYCTDVQKADYFKMNNLAFQSCATEVTAWTPLAGVWPTVEDRVLILNQVDATVKSFDFDFTPLRDVSDENGNHIESPYLVPPGTYRFAIGFKQNMGVVMKIELCRVIGQDTLSLGVGTVDTGNAAGTAYHYDRGATLSNTYPEGYYTSDPALANASKKQNYDTDGGLVLTEVEIPDEGVPAVQLLIRIHADDVGTVTKYTFNHWCLRPTTNNY